MKGNYPFLVELNCDYLALCVLGRELVAAGRQGYQEFSKNGVVYRATNSIGPNGARIPVPIRDADEVLSVVRQQLQNENSIGAIAGKVGLTEDQTKNLIIYARQADSIAQEIEDARGKIKGVNAELLGLFHRFEEMSDAEKQAFLIGYDKTPSPIQDALRKSVLLGKGVQESIKRHNKAIEALRKNKDYQLLGELAANSVDTLLLTLILLSPYAMPAASVLRGKEVMVVLSQVVATKTVVKGGIKAIQTYKKEDVENLLTMATLLSSGAILASLFRLINEKGGEVDFDKLVHLLLSVDGKKWEELNQTVNGGVTMKEMDAFLLKNLVDVESLPLNENQQKILEIIQKNL